MWQLMPEIQTLVWLMEWPRFLHLPAAPIWNPSMKCPICTGEDDQRGKNRLCSRQAFILSSGRLTTEEQSHGSNNMLVIDCWWQGFWRKKESKKERKTGCQMQNLPLVGDDHKILKKRKFPNANPSCSQQDPEPRIFQHNKNLLFSEEDKRMP